MRATTTFLALLLALTATSCLDAPAQTNPDAGGPGADGAAGDAAGGPIPPERGLLIVTTAAVASGSQQLAKFAAAKRQRGMRVTVATEADYGGADERGVARAERIRTWLRSHYYDYGFLLLVGDPSTQYGDVPMLKVRPRDDLQNACGGIDCETSGTDAFYANPNGRWDLDGNGWYGEYGVDDGPGGLDLWPELTVGRIPVYFGDTAELDRTLEHLMAYTNAAPEQIEYRRRILFAKSFVFFKGEVFFPLTPPIGESVDTAVTSEWFIRNYLPAERGVGYTRLYERSGHVTSEFASEGALTEEGFIDEWQHGYGMVWWGGHGAPTSVARTVWSADPNGNDAADDGELESPTLIKTEDAARLDGTPGGFVVATSCYVGRIEVPNALSYTLLRYGAAVGVIASSAPASADEGAFARMGTSLDRSRFDVDRLAVMVFDGLLHGEPAGTLVTRARIELGPTNDIDSYQQKLMLNFYGDPTATLYDSAADAR
ncbi:MAG: hypothetical protein HY906_12410 [Deltaproteobacteria bacterium]|nr:hypothetical protein [Deltaproteobacteria bacterium]